MRTWVWIPRIHIKPDEKHPSTIPPIAGWEAEAENLLTGHLVWQTPKQARTLFQSKEDSDDQYLKLSSVCRPHEGYVMCPHSHILISYMVIKKKIKRNYKKEKETIPSKLNLVNQ